MNIVLNGTREQVPDSATLLDILELKGLLDKKVAVEINEEIIPRSQHQHTLLQAGDCVEIIQAIGGG